MRDWLLRKLGGAAPPPYETVDPLQASHTQQAIIQEQKQKIAEMEATHLESIEEYKKKLNEVEVKFAKLQIQITTNRQAKEPSQRILVAPDIGLNPRPGEVLRPWFPPKTCSKSRLPHGLSNHITDLLSPVDLLVLSHTCKSIHGSLQPNIHKARQNLTLQSHRQYLQLLCKESSTHFPCFDCNDVHSLDMKSYNMVQQPGCRPANAMPRMSLPGRLRVHPGHVKLACVLGRRPSDLLSSGQQEFLTSFLARFRVQPKELNVYSSRFSAEAHIRSGMFVLRREWRRQRRGCDPEDTFGELQICPHQNAALEPEPPKPRGTYQNRRLRNSLRRVGWLFESRASGACPVCPTEWVVSLDAGQCITLTVYQILGSNTIDSYRYWEAQLWKDRIPVVTAKSLWPSGRTLVDLKMER